ncbi:hypothetical protein GJ496_007431 [Pomphorhynchus laevis]|nr:hypothetical protein GJ496_007431 [Pomphorhynchus laevis]
MNMKYSTDLLRINKHGDLVDNNFDNSNTNCNALKKQNHSSKHHHFTFVDHENHSSVIASKILPVLDKIRSVRIRSKSESQPNQEDSLILKNSDHPPNSANKGILKRLLLKRHRAKHQKANTHGCHTVNSEDYDDKCTPFTPPSVGLLEGILPPNSEYYVTVSGGDRSKLLTFHPKLAQSLIEPINTLSPTTPPLSLSKMFDNYPQSSATTNQNDISDSRFNTSEVFCAKIVPNMLNNSNARPSSPNIQLETVSKSKYFVSALNSERDISNLSQLPASGRSLPGLTHFIYKAPPLGASVDIGVNEEILTLFDDREIYSQFMKSHTCYQILAKSSILFVFDSTLEVCKAFKALFDNGIRAAIIWDASKQTFTGMVTITDVIRRIRSSNFALKQNIFSHFDTLPISSIRSSSDDKLLSIGLYDSLYEAIKQLSKYNIHRITVRDAVNGDAISIITHKRLLRFLYLYIYELTRPSYLTKDINSLKVGTYENIYTVNPGDPILVALDIFIERDQELTINDGLSRRQSYEQCHTFTLNESLLTIIERLVDKRVHRLIGIDDEGKVIGVISLSDILCFLVLHAPRHKKVMANPCESSEPANNALKSVTAGPLYIVGIVLIFESSTT